MIKIIESQSHPFNLIQFKLYSTTKKLVLFFFTIKIKKIPFK